MISEITMDISWVPPTGRTYMACVYIGDLAHEDRNAVLGSDDHLLQIPRALHEAESAHDRPGPARFDDVAADVAVAPHDGVDDGGERDAVGAEAVRVDVDLVLAHRAADARDLGHARHRVQLVADEPVLERPEVAKRDSLALHRVPEDVADPRRVGTERRHDATRQRFRD